jgi:hypothetical protein
MPHDVGWNAYRAPPLQIDDVVAYLHLRRAVDEDVDLLLPLVTVAVALRPRREAEVADAAVLALERDAPETKVELVRIEPEVRRLIFDLGQVDMLVLRHQGPPRRRRRTLYLDFAARKPQ